MKLLKKIKASALVEKIMIVVFSLVAGAAVITFLVNQIKKAQDIDVDVSLIQDEFTDANNDNGNKDSNPGQLSWEDDYIVIDLRNREFRGLQDGTFDDYDYEEAYMLFDIVGSECAYYVSSLGRQYDCAGTEEKYYFFASVIMDTPSTIEDYNKLKQIAKNADREYDFMVLVFDTYVDFAAFFAYLGADDSIPTWKFSASVPSSSFDIGMIGTFEKRMEIEFDYDPFDVSLLGYSTYFTIANWSTEFKLSEINDDMITWISNHETGWFDEFANEFYNEFASYVLS